MSKSMAFLISIVLLWGSSANAGTVILQDPQTDITIEIYTAAMLYPNNIGMQKSLLDAEFEVSKGFSIKEIKDITRADRWVTTCDIVESNERKVGVAMKKIANNYQGFAGCTFKITINNIPGFLEPQGALIVSGRQPTTEGRGNGYVTFTANNEKFIIPPGLNNTIVGQYKFKSKMLRYWQGTFPDQIELNTQRDTDTVLITAELNSTGIAYVTATPKNVDAGFDQAVRISKPDGQACSTGLNAGEQCIMYVNKDKVRPGETKGQIVLNIRLP
ncbi:hypothetical protein CV016_19985 [Yersinia kristensenii]|uniref:hypothetical protein n=1 Tax=Yersinia kristensenii TaxID=28152 RepID=UPI000C21BD17|nr:hypothetical protein [Yersinia kristensenii]PJG60980.1 hypothetical protein CV016_19985 [Yersinia kristensenii]